MVTALDKARKMGARKTNFLAFAECHDHGTRQRIFFKKNSNFAECRPEGTRQRFFLKKNSNFAERRTGALDKEFLEKK